MTEKYCRNRDELLTALNIALDNIEEPITIRCGKSFSLALDLSKVPQPVPFKKEWTKSMITSEDRYNALTCEERYRKNITKWVKAVKRSPQYLWNK